MQFERPWTDVRNHTSPLKLGTIYLDSPRPIVRQTTLVRDGSPAASIVCPAAGGYLRIAETVQRDIAERSGVSLPIVEAETAVDGDGAVQVDTTRPVLAIGNLLTNPLMAELYHLRYVACDGAYPGAGGHVLRTVFDPWGTGANVVVVGGSDPAGCDAAAAALARTVAVEGDTVFADAVTDIVVGKAFRDRYGNIPFRADDHHIRKSLEAARRRIEGGGHRGITPNIAHAGIMYHLTGDEGFAVLFRELFKMIYELALQNPGGGMWCPWGRAADFQSAAMVPAWYLVDSSPTLSEEDRRYITNHMLEYLHNNVAEVELHRPDDLAVSRHNHYTFAAIGLLYGAHFFSRHYDWHETDAWYRMIDECFEPQLRAWKSQEECNCYQWLTFYHVLLYALLRPARSFIRDGYAETCLRHGIATMDSFGHQAPYGDCSSYKGSGSERYYFQAAAWAVGGDELFEKAISRKDENRTPHDITWLYPVGYEYAASGVSKAGASRAPALEVLPVDPTYYYTNRSEMDPQRERCFDKIAVRGGLDTDDEYLLLSGLSNGGHGHYDGNGILRLCADGRLWLADGDYMKQTQKFHNTLVVLRNGICNPIPPYVVLEQAGQLADFTYTATAVPGFNGATWRRHILRRRGAYFLVVDDVEAEQAGDYDLRQIFRTVGTVHQQGAAFAVDQQGRTLVIHGDGGSDATVSYRLMHEPIIWSDWDEYPFGDGTREIRVIEGTVACRLQAGERVTLGAVLAPASGGQVSNVRRPAEGGLVFAAGGTPVRAGTGPVDLGPARVAAAFVHASGNEAAAFGLHRVLIGEDLRAAMEPAVAAVFTFGNGVLHLRFQTDGEVQLSLHAPDGATATVDGTPASHSGAVTLAAGAHELTLPCPSTCAVPEPAPATRPGRYDRPSPLRAVHAADRRPRWRTGGRGNPVTALAAAGDLVVAAWADGRVAALRDGEPAWEYAAAGRVHALHAADLDGDGADEVLLGSADEHVHVLAADGRLANRIRIPFYEHTPEVTVVTSARFAEGPERAIVAGSLGSRFYAYRPDGTELWRYEINHGATWGAARDVDGDGRDEVLAVTEWHMWHCIDAEGRRRWLFRPRGTARAPGANRVRIGDMDGDGRLEAVFAGRDGNTYVADAATGEQRFAFYCGDEVLDALPLDAADGGGVLVGSYNGYVYGLDAAGALRWRLFLEAPVDSLHPLPPDAADGGLAGCVAVTRLGSLCLLGLDGVLRRRYDAPGRISCARVHAGASRTELLVGLTSGELEAVELSP